MNTRIIVVRHGNTFATGETPKRVGQRTDLPLVERAKSVSVAHYLLKNNIIPDIVYSSPLKRTLETARIVLDEMELGLSINHLELLREIDYGPDENRTEDETRLRLGSVFFENTSPGNKHAITGAEIKQKGKEIIDEWDKNAVVPPGWVADPEKIKNLWHKFADDFEQKLPGKTAILFSSNGVIRFAPCLTESFEAFSQNNSIKVATGSIGIFEKNHQNKSGNKPDGSYWQCTAWNISP